ncbi:zinc transporter ZIP1-like [Embiotoca jacksoni]|uniref:zinc transporter ZIP1-like n=1 Tax=Embiotoca jacksoni TaxID=100190 RepID=UPI0037044DD9
MAMGFFLVLVLEQVVLASRDRTSSLVEERRALLVDSSVQSEGRSWAESEAGRRRSWAESDSHLPVDVAASQSALRAFILVFSLSLHSVFEGLGAGLLEEGAELLEVCLALMIHKSIVSFSLTFKLSQGRLRRSVVVGCLLLFAAMTPLGVGLGVALTETRTSPRHRLARCTLEGLAVGTFVYITFMEILPHELGSARHRIPKVAALLMGFAVVTAVLFIKL